MTIAVFLFCIAMLFGQVSAQTIPGDVTFEVPVNLTRLSPYLSKVAVTCQFGSTIDPNIGTVGMTSGATGVLYKMVELPVSAGQVVTTALSWSQCHPPDFKPGQSLMYQCALTALSSEPGVGSSWQPFDPKNGASFNVSPTPLPITGKFEW
jgi:hypothetical protein